MKRGATPIYYTDFSDLKSIIQLNWPDFEDLFHDVNWVIMRFTELEASRNIVAHNNVLEKNEIDRIKMYLVDLGATSRLASSVESRCPPKVLDTQSAALDLQAQAACGGGESLLRYDPGANRSTVLLGPPLNGGSVSEALAYPGQN